MSRPYFYALGKRKSAIAKVRVFQEGEGKVTVNGDGIDKYHNKDSN
jgi:small subunit ribosomal protein S9